MGNIRIDYRTLKAQVNAQAKRLWELGVRPGTHVAVICPARPEFFVSFLAITSLGAVYQGLSPKSAAPELAYQVSDSGVGLLLWHGDLANEVAAKQVAAAVTHPVTVLQGDALQLVDGDEFTPPAEMVSAMAAVKGDTPAAIVYTSGTTGRPKGAMLTQYGFTACSYIQVQRWTGTEPPRMPCIEPINHVSSIGDGCTFLLVAGGTVVFQEQFQPEQMLRLIVEEKCNLWYTDPAVLSLCTRSPEWELTDLSRLDRICWSGGRAPLSLAEKVAGRVPRVGTSWGMTETVGSLTYTDDEASLEVLSSTIGRLSPEYEGRVVCDDGREAGRGETGELQVRGRHIVQSYWNMPEVTRKAFTEEGWFKTGDLVTVWDDGNLELVGRRSEMYKSGGENIYPAEVEAALEAHPAVSAAVVVSVPDELWGEVGYTFLIPHGEVSVEELREHLRKHLARFKVPKVIEFIPEFPLMPNGKVDRRALKSAASKEVAQ